MNAFMQISRIISQPTIKVVNTSDKINRDLSSEIDRLEKYVKTLETISKKYSVDVSNDFIKIHNLIEKTRNQINDENIRYDEIIDEIKLF